jgi:phosphoribosylformylglycinamidine synthase
MAAGRRRKGGSAVVIARIFVTPKREVLDPQGTAIRHSLHALGYAEVEEVRLGKYLELRLASDDPGRARDRIDEMCRRLLANQVIEEYRFELELVPSAARLQPSR